MWPGKVKSMKGEGEVRILVKDKSFYKTLWPLIIVVALQNVITLSVNLADNVMLGAYSELALSGAAIVNQIQFLLHMLVMGVCDGVLVMASRYWGRGDIASIKKVVSLGMLLSVLISVGLWAAVWFWPNQCLGLLTNEPEVIAVGAEYMRIVCFTYFFFAITNMLVISMRSVETASIGFIVALISLGVNVVLNYTLIFGNFGAPRLGVRGAAIATLVARVVETLIVAIYVLGIDKKIKMALRDFFRIDKSLVRQFMKVVMPVVLSGAVWGIAMAVQMGILGRMGAPVIAANSIALTVAEVVTVVAYASASASSVVIAKTVGTGAMDKIKPYTRTLQILFLIIGVATGAVLFLVKDLIIGFYVLSPAAYEYALQFMTVLSITVVGTAYQMPALTGIVRGGGDTSFVMKNDLIFMWGIVLPLSMLGAFVWNLPPAIVFLLLKSDQILKCFVAVVKVNRYTWIKKIDNSEKLDMEEGRCSA